MRDTERRSLAILQKRMGAAALVSHVRRPRWQERTYRYSSFGIGVDRKHALQRLLDQEKATFHRTQRVQVYFETALRHRHRSQIRRGAANPRGIDTHDVIVVLDAALHTPVNKRCL